MPALREEEAHHTTVREGVHRRLIHGENLMMVVIDFDNGPWKRPDPLHDHVHEQTTYVAEGEIAFICEGEPDQHLKKGDMFCVPSGKQHTIQLLTKKAKLIDSFSPIRKDFL
jgi:quercetin dioxygenase-like cupin family protein